jgi:PAS domain S-box-containing protein
MTTHIHKEDLIAELAAHFQPILEHSPQGIYLWLDEGYKICNERLAEMFGYTIEEWRVVPAFLEGFVASEDRQLFSENYSHAIYELTAPITFRFQAIRKDGSNFLAETDMIPVVYQGQQVAYHFVREVGA